MDAIPAPPTAGIDRVRTRSRRMPRARRGYYLTWLAVAFGVTVVATRMYLQITGFPQVGGGTFHLAHAVWGGLLLMVAAVWALMWAHRAALTTTAILAGIGSGLFIDEIGKFITTRNDYFFPLAAPLIYITGLALIGVALVAGRRELTPDEHASAALERFSDALAGPMDPRVRHNLDRDLAALADDPGRPDLQELGAALTDWLDHHHDPTADRLGTTDRVRAWGLRMDARVPTWVYRAVCMVTDVVMLVIGLGNLLVLLALVLLAGDYRDVSLSVDETPVAGRGELVVLGVSAVLSVVVGGLAVRAIYRGLRRRPYGAVQDTIRGLLVLLVGVNVLTGYFSAGAVAVTVALELLALLAAVRFRDRVRPGADPVSR